MRHRLGLATRALRRTPGTTFIALITIAAAVGVNTAMFSVLDAIVLRPLAYPNAGRIIVLHSSEPDAGVSPWVAYELPSRTRAIERAATYGDGQWTRTGDGAPEVLRGMRVSAGFFDVLGVRPMLGRTFTADDERREAPVVVLDYTLWRDRFGADRDVVGKTFTLNGRGYQVIGVLPPSFHPLRMTNPAEIPRIYAPAAFDPARAAQCRACTGPRTIALLGSGVSVREARAEISRVAGNISREFRADFPSGLRVTAAPLKETIVGSAAATMWTLFGAVAAVLVLACANVAGIQLSRAIVREPEFAVQAALGAGRWRIVRQMLTEATVLCLAGAGAGVAVGAGAVRAIAVFAPREIPRLDEIRLNPSVLACAAAALMLATIVAAVVPSWFATRVDLRDMLQRGNRRTSSGGAHRTLRTIVIVEVASAFVLVFGTGLLVRTFSRLAAVDPGFRAARVLTLTPAFSPAAGRSPEVMLRTKRGMVTAVRSIPGVVEAGMTDEVPMARSTVLPCEIDGQPAAHGAEAHAVLYRVSPGYLATMGMPLLRGRALTDRDGVGEPAAAIVSESFARHNFGTAPAALGHRLRFEIGHQSNVWLTIVGIVRDVRNEALDRPADDAVYETDAADPVHYARMVVRVEGDPSGFARQVAAAIRTVDPNTGVFHVQPMTDYVDASLAPRRFAFALMSAFGVLALMLAAVGVYGVLSLAVSQRTGELGIRAALGATPATLMTMVVRGGLLLSAVGCTAGAAAAMLAGQTLGGLLFGIGPHDIGTASATAVVLLAVAGAASAIPALRASRADPAVAMRQS